MSAQEIVLKFIKCPSCKSLMPSTAVKCGMCGFELKIADDEVASESLKKSRLRQRTTSLPGDFLTEPKDHTENYTEGDSQLDDSQGGSSQGRTLGRDENSYDERLSAARADRAVERRAQESAGVQRDEAPRGVSSTAFLQKSASTSRESLNFRTDVSTSESQGYSEAETEDEFEDDHVDEQDVTSAAASGAQRDISAGEESGATKKRKRRRKKKKRVNELLGETDKAGQENSTDNEKHADFSDAQAVDHPGEQNNDVVRNSDRERIAPASKISAARPRDSGGELETHPRGSGDTDPGYIRDRLSSEVEYKEVPVARPPVSIQQNEGQMRHHSSKVNIPNGEKKKMGRDLESSQLIGWFVNYSTHQSGIAFEIRQGKQFVGRQALRSDDLVISDSAVSTPHCLLQVENADSVFLQDLMSEHGTFVKKNGQKDFQQLESSITLEHGDRLKLGSYELVVCLIP